MTSILAPGAPPADAAPRVPHAKRAIGASLLGNWVEERSCCALGLDDRPVARAHTDLLVHTPPTLTYETTQQAMSASVYPPMHLNNAGIPESAAPATPVHTGPKPSGGKRHQATQARLLREAVRDATAAAQREADLHAGAAPWESTFKSDYGHEDIYGRVEDLGVRPPSEEDSRRFETPITFWSDFAVKGSGTTISSLKATPYADANAGHTYEWRGNEPPRRIPGPIGHRAGQAFQHRASGAAVRFGKHADFTTPIEEFSKGPVKDL